MLKAGKRIQLNQTPSRVSHQQPISIVSSAPKFRYEKQNPILKAAIADRLERFNRICQQALELFEDETETQRWLSTPKVTLGGQTSLGVLSTDAGAKRVEEILYRAEYGMFG